LLFLWTNLYNGKSGFTCRQTNDLPDRVTSLWELRPGTPAVVIGSRRGERNALRLGHVWYQDTFRCAFMSRNALPSTLRFIHVSGSRRSFRRCAVFFDICVSQQSLDMILICVNELVYFCKPPAIHVIKRSQFLSPQSRVDMFIIDQCVTTFIQITQRPTPGFAKTGDI
jgi:hypothetical protein